MKEGRSTLARGAYVVGALLAVWLGLSGYARLMAPDERVDPSGRTIELSRQEIRRLSQLHGTHVIKVERDTVSILRDGRWIPLPKDDRG